MINDLSVFSIIVYLTVCILFTIAYIVICSKADKLTKAKGYKKKLVGLKCFILGLPYFIYLAALPDLVLIKKQRLITDLISGKSVDELDFEDNTPPIMALQKTHPAFIAAVAAAAIALTGSGIYEGTRYKQKLDEISDLQHKLCSQEWVSTEKIENSSSVYGLGLRFEDNVCTYTFYSGTSLVDNDTIAVYNYEIIDGNTVVFSENGYNLQSTIQFAEDDNYLIITPSITDTEESKVWLSLSYIQEAYPALSTIFE